MVNSEPLSIMSQVTSNRISPQNYNQQYDNPNTTKLTLEQQYHQLAQQILPNQQGNSVQSNPYDDFRNTLNSCSDIVRGKIIQDTRFQNIYTTCEEAIKQVLYAKVIPEVLSDPNGRMVFEQMYVTTKALKDELLQKDIQKEQQLEILMNDEVVLKRLQEIQSGKLSSEQNQSSGNQDSQKIQNNQQKYNNNQKNSFRE